MNQVKTLQETAGTINENNNKKRALTKALFDQVICSSVSFKNRDFRAEFSTKPLISEYIICNNRNIN